MCACLSVCVIVGPYVCICMHVCMFVYKYVYLFVFLGLLCMMYLRWLYICICFVCVYVCFMYVCVYQYIYEISSFGLSWNVCKMQYCFFFLDSFAPLGVFQVLTLHLLTSCELPREKFLEMNKIDCQIKGTQSECRYVRMYMYVFMYLVYACMHVCMYVYVVYVHMCILHVCMCAHMCVCVYVCICVPVCA